MIRSSPSVQSSGPRSARPRSSVRDRSTAVVGLLSALAAVGLVVLAIAAQRPPAAVSASAPPTVFSAERALEHVRVIAREPHAVGTAANAAVRDYLLAELAALGLETEVQRATAVSDRFGATAVVDNVLGRLRGARPAGMPASGAAAGGAVLLMAHYDSVTTAPGAADNGAAVAAILEGLRALQAGDPLANDVLVLFSDAEEVGLLGAEAFAAEHPWMTEVALVINLEARGTSGPAVLVETQRGNAGLMRAFGAVDPYPNASSMSFEIYNLLPNDTDFTVFKERGIAGFNFAFIRDLAHYHSANDAVEHLSLRSLQHHGEHVVALTRHFGDADLGAPLLSASDAVYFDVLRRGLVRYDASWALPSAIVAVLALLAVMVRAHALRHARPVRVALAALATLLVAALAGVASFVALALLARLEPAFGSVAMATPYGAEITMAALALLAALVVVLGTLLAGRWLRPVESILGAYAVWATLTLAVGAALPGGSYLFVWPLLGGVLALALVLRWTELGGWPRSPASVVVLLLGGLPALLLLPPFLAEGFIGLSLALAPVLVVIIALATSLLLPLLGAMLAPRRAVLPLALALAAAALFVAGARSAAFGDARPFPVNAFYIVDAERDAARFVSFVAESDPWTASFFGDARVADLSDVVPDAWPMRSAAAPVLSLPAPTVELLTDTVDGSTRRLTLRIASQRAAPQLAVLVAPHTPVDGVRLNGRPVGALARPNGWTRLVVYGPMGEGVEVELTTRVGADVDLVLVDTTNDLFDHPELAVPERPPGTMPAPSRLSDAVMVVRAWSPPVVGSDRGPEAP